MAKFTVEYELTERTVQRVMVEADNMAEAIELVKNYEFDNGGAWQTDSIEWSLDNAKGIEP